MLTQRLIWTALPNGVINGKLRLSVFLSPRLETDGSESSLTLGQFPDFVNWPSSTANLGFTVEFGGGAVSLPAAQVGPGLRSDLWTALFRPSTPVTPLRAQFPQLPKVRSFPLRDVHHYLRSQYVKVAKASPTDHPTTGALGVVESYGGAVARGGFGFLAFDDQAKIGRIREVEGAYVGAPYGGVIDPPREAYGGPGGVNPDDEAAVRRAFLQAELFHARKELTDLYAPPTGAAALAPAAPALALDFHRVLAALHNYPQLLRLLGLVRDIQVDFPAGISSPTTVRVLPTGFTPAAGPTPASRSMYTSATLAATQFMTAPKSYQVTNGFFDLSDRGRYGFDVFDADVDGATLKALTFADNLARSITQKSLDTPKSFAVPSIRSAGLTVAKRGRAVDIFSALQNQQKLEAAQSSDSLSTVPLGAEDVIRGYKVDVWDDRTNRWHTICARRGTYKFSGNLTLQLDDEGAVTVGASKGTPNLADDFFLHESLFRWSGWSAVAPRPGQVILPDANQTVGTPPTTPDPNFPLQVSFVPQPGSLPKLRYGTTYRLRVRVVDLAGNSVALNPTSTDFSTATRAIRFGRFDPVGVPFSLPRKPVTPGEAGETLVVRSNYNTSAGPGSERHLAPPKVAELTAEEHGLFDANGRPNTFAYGQIKSYESGSFKDSGAPDPNAAGSRYYDDPSVKVPYIPDPLSRGAALSGLPGTAAGTPFIVPFALPTGLNGLLLTLLGGASPFPNGYSFRVVVLEGNAGPTFDGDNRLLTVYLPKATVTRVRLSSYLAAGDLNALGLWRWLQEEGQGLTPAQQTQLTQLATTGQHWMLTPYRTLTLVHAVRQPLVAPRFAKPAALRQVGDTFITVVDTLAFSRTSTSRVDVRADWTEYTDALADPAPRQVAANANPFAFTIDPSDIAGDVIGVNDRHEFRDTKHRVVSYSAVATSRFVEYFAQRKDVALNGTSPLTIDAAGFVPQTATVRSADGTTTYQAGTDFIVDETKGTVARTAASAIPSGATVGVTYVAPPVTRSSTELPAAPVVDVPSAARPDPPKVKYVVPTFGWDLSRNAVSATSVRQGGGLRVYLDRPWYSSGQDEQLAVVLWRRDPNSTILDPPGQLAHRVTQLALDPLWISGPATENPTAAAFPLTVLPAFDLSLAELPGGDHVDAAPHAVGYDADRQLWYCDIVIAPGPTYTPFVRLALARYQLHSLPDCYLSPVVLADFAQLAPDRSASVTFVTGSTTTVNVSVSGLSHRGSVTSTRTARPGPTNVYVTVQGQQAGVTGELAWTDRVAPTGALSTVANPDGTTTWSGQVTLPAPRGSTPFRLVFQEYETYDFDSTGYAAGDPRAQPTAQRLVYTDTLEI